MQEIAEKLPYLYAVYTITWLVFFVYVFFVSRRQREMEREIHGLKRALELKENPEEPYSRITG